MREDMALIITCGRDGKAPKRVGKFKSVQEAARALAAALNMFPENKSDPVQRCWWGRDDKGRTYRLEVNEAVSGDA